MVPLNNNTKLFIKFVVARVTCVPPLEGWDHLPPLDLSVAMMVFVRLVNDPVSEKMTCRPSTVHGVHLEKL